MAEIKTPKPFSHHTAITSLDGRFRGRTEEFNEYFSEYATNKWRVYVEIEYLIAFLQIIGRNLDKKTQKSLREIASNFSLEDQEYIWKIDEEINHDTKAVEYFLGSQFKKLKLEHLTNYLHIGLTSTDVDGPAFTLGLSKFHKEVLVDRLEKLIKVLKKLADEHKDVIMPGRTHGQIAVPTTAGKEFAYFLNRLETQYKKINDMRFGSKISGAVGNHNALKAAFPDIDWLKFSQIFLSNLGLESYPLSTQVEPYDHKIEYIQAVKRINLIVMAIDEDIWRYLALGYLSLRDKEGHVGSSTMPQKINPIGFELSENYTSLANGIFNVCENKLPLNRWQRDLTDKYLLRDLGQALVMSTLSYESTAESLQQIGFNKGLVGKDLDEHWEIIAEGIQTILRTTTYTKPYEKLKELTRGKKITREGYENFINEIEVHDEIKVRLRGLSSNTYIGFAKELTNIALNEK